MSKPRKSQTKYDGIGSRITPQTKGASAGLGLPSRVHAIHVVLTRASGPIPLDTIKEQLTSWGYDQKTVNVTHRHLDSLVNGLMGYPKAVVATPQGYELIQKYREQMESGDQHPFM